MMWLTENIQVCLRIFRRTQHQWLSRDVLHQPQGVFTVFVLHPVSASLSVLSVVEQKNLSSGVLPLTLLNLGCTRHSSSQLSSALICTRFQAAFVVCYLYRGRCPRLLMVVPSRHQSASGLYFTTDLTNRTDSCPIWEQNINQKNPLARMESVALMLCFRSGLIRASS